MVCIEKVTRLRAVIAQVSWHLLSQGYINNYAKNSTCCQPGCLNLRAEWVVGTGVCIYSSGNLTYSMCVLGIWRWSLVPVLRSWVVVRVLPTVYNILIFCEVEKSFNLLYYLLLYLKYMKYTKKYKNVQNLKSHK